MAKWPSMSAAMKAENNRRRPESGGEKKAYVISEKRQHWHISVNRNWRNNQWRKENNIENNINNGVMAASGAGESSSIESISVSQRRRSAIEKHHQTKA
jgi:hypothetical protein